MKVQAARITEARELRSLNISDLAKLLGVTRQSISLYEQGERTPKDSIVTALAEKLNFPIDFFYKEKLMVPHKRSAAFYRSFKSASAKSRTATLRVAEKTFEIYEYINHYLNLPQYNPPVLDFMMANGELTQDKIAAIAHTLREYWGLGEAPIPSLLTLLESKGIVISNGKAIGGRIDACYMKLENKPFIVIGENELGEGSAFRQNFSLAHELGHLLLHGHITQEDLENPETLKMIEEQANCFASEFLLPESSFAKSVYSTSLDFFVGLKKKWHVSAAAMIYRCHELGLIDDQANLYLRKQISYKKWKSCEPYDRETPVPKANLFRLAFDVLFENKADLRNDFMNEIAMFESDIESICCLPTNYFQGFDHKVSVSIAK